MFEKYKLLKVDIPKAMTNADFSDSSKPLLSRIKEQPSGRDVEQILNSSAGNSPTQGEFALVGSGEVLPLFLAENADMSGIIQLQSFAVFNSGAGYFTRRENYNSVLLSFTYAGEGTLIYGGNTYVLHKGEGFLIDCRNRQEYFTSADDWNHMDLHFTGEPADLLYREIHAAASVKFSVGYVESFNKKIEAFLDACTTVSPHRNIYVHEALSSLLVWILRENELASRPVIPKVYQELVRYMEANFRQPITLDDLAAKAYLNKYHLIKEFKRYIGSTPHDYLISLRILNAGFLLQNTDIPVSQVGLAAGFENITNFMRLFKKHMGMTPGEYRNKR